MYSISRTILSTLIGATSLCALDARAAAVQPELGSMSTPTISVDNLRFRDLNRNGRLDPYEDWRLPIEMRIDDLVGRMTLEEKAGLMVHGTAVSPDSEIGLSTTGYDLAAIRDTLAKTHVASLITRLDVPPGRLAEQNNRLQELAESSRLGIPLSVSTDPRHHFQFVAGASATANGFSQWPEPLGFAAIGDTQLVQRFADSARREYRATGIHIALSPQADLASEPRWPRIVGTFGEDPELAKRLVGAYVRGMQNGAKGVGRDSVVAVVKHWVGYGAAAGGYDAHNYYGRFAEFSKGKLADHIKPFEEAFEDKVGAVMPTYAILRGAGRHGTDMEPVGAAYNSQLLTALLRGTFGFKGMVLSDWAITMDCNTACTTGEPIQQPRDIGTPWGVERLSKVERFAKAIQAGVDQLGGTNESGFIVQAVREGKVSEARINQSAHRILIQKFQQGLFEDPYVDADAAQRIVGSAELRAAGLDAQRRSLVLLQNEGKFLPLRPAMKKLYVVGINADVARSYGFSVVGDPAEADVAIVRASAPFETLHAGYFFGRRQHEGSLDFADDNADLLRIKTIAARVPTVVVIFLDRPAILTKIRQATRAMVADFGASDTAILDAVTGRSSPQGKLPFQLPATMESVARQASDVPSDIENPLYPKGWGLHY